MIINRYTRFCAAYILFVPIIAFIFASCNGDNVTSVIKPLKFNTINHVIELDDPTQSYELYLPTGFNDKVKWPVAFLFDPHGGGLFAVDQCKEAAERYGYILVGSNNSKNGITNSSDIANALFTDVLKRFAIDQNRVYAVGFSGGGRVASQLALANSQIRGIITCSAGLPKFDPLSLSRKFEIYATAGKHDFNYDEVSAISKQLNQTDWRHLVTAFDGGHSWPPISFINEAFAWFNLNAMRDKLIEKDKPFLKQIHDDIISNTERLLSANQFVLAFNECNNGITKLDGLYNVKKLRKKLEIIQKMDQYEAEMRKAEGVKFTEMKLRDAYMQNFTVQNVNWWTNEINALHSKIANEKDSLSRQMYSRVKGFLGIVCYSYTARAINAGDYTTAEKCINVYQVAEPKNPDCYYFKALLLEKRNKTKEAADNLIIAKKLGFSDTSKLNQFSAKTIEGAR